MQDVSFKSIFNAWKKISNNPHIIEDMKRTIPNLTNPSKILIRNNTQENDADLHIEFINLLNAMKDSNGIEYMKRWIYNWLKEISDSVQMLSIGGDPGTVNFKISRHKRFDEAAIPILRRDSKTNKVKRVYKCIGGKKDGKKVANPDQCLKVPDFFKRANLSITKRAKQGQSKKSKTKTKLTNIIAKKVRRRNQMIKKSRGF